MFNIPLFQWLAGVITDFLKPPREEKPSSEISPSTSHSQNSADVAESLRDHAGATYRVRIAQLQQQLDRVIIQRRRAYGYLAASLVAAAAFLYLEFGPHHLLPLWVVGLPIVPVLASLAQSQKCTRRARESSQLLEF